MIFDRVIENITNGMSGKNVGLPNGLDRINRYINNLQKGTYYLIGGEPGTGKSAICDHMFVYSPFDHLLRKQNRNIKIIYFSLEMAKEIKLTKAAARRLYLDKGTLTDINYLLSRGNNKVSTEVKKLIEEQRYYFEKLEEVLTIKDGSYTPQDIKAELLRYSNSNGKWIEKPNGLDYQPYRDEYTIIIIDHIGLIKPAVNKIAA